MARGGLVARVKVRLFKGFRPTHRVDSLVVDRTLNAITVRSGPGTPMNEPHPSVAEALASLAITHEIIPCDPAFADTAEFCREYGYPLETSANTIIVTSTRGEKVYSACLVQASAKLDVNHVVKRLMGASRISFASADETRELTGMEIGGVTVFGLPAGLPLYADEALKAQPYIIVGSGNRMSKVKMAPAELAKIPNCSFINDLSIS